MRRKINLPLTKELRAEYESGATLAQLAEKYGCAVSTIYTRLRLKKFKTRGRGRGKANLPMAQVISDYQSGMSLRDLGEKYGVSYHTIRTRMNEAGFRCLRYINLPMEEVISDYESGMSATQLGEKYGCSDNTIRTRLKEAGVQLRKYTLGKWVERWGGEERNEKIADMYHQQGKTLQEVGAEFSLTGERVRQILNKMGVGTRERVAKTDLDETEMGELKVMLGEGLTLKKISEHFGMQVRHISAVIKREGLTKTYVPNVKWDYKKAEEEYLSGVPLKEIARRHGLSSYNMIVYVMGRLGHEPRKGSRQVFLPMEEVISDYESGMTQTEIAEKYGCSVPPIARILREAGVQPRSGSRKVLPISEIWFDYESGMTLSQLAKKYGVTRGTIKTRLKETRV